MLVSDPKSLALALPPPIFWTAIGINVRPITVISVPVTTGGKRRLTLENWPETKQTKIPATMIAPYIVWIVNWLPIIFNGSTAWIAQPKTTGRPIPKYRLRMS